MNKDDWRLSRYNGELRKKTKYVLSQPLMSMQITGNQEGSDRSALLRPPFIYAAYY